MSATLYVLNISPRSTFLIELAKYVNYDLEIVEANTIDRDEFKQLFPLGKTPALQTADGEKITELLALIYHFLLDSEKSDLLGLNHAEKVDNLRWLSFLNSDFSTTLGTLLYATTEDAKKAALEEVFAHLKYINDTALNIKKETGLAKLTLGNSFLVADLCLTFTLKALEAAGVDYSAFEGIVELAEKAGAHPFWSA